MVNYSRFNRCSARLMLSAAYHCEKRPQGSIVCGGEKSPGFVKHELGVNLTVRAS